MITRLTKYYWAVRRWKIQISTLLVIRIGEVWPVLVSRGNSKLINLVAHVIKATGWRTVERCLVGWWADWRLKIYSWCKKGLKSCYHVVTLSSLPNALHYTHLNRIELILKTLQGIIRLSAATIWAARRLRRLKYLQLVVRNGFQTLYHPPTFLSKLIGRIMKWQWSAKK